MRTQTCWETLSVAILSCSTYRYLVIHLSHLDSPSLHHSASLWRYRSPGPYKQTAWSCRSWDGLHLWELGGGGGTRRVDIMKNKSIWKTNPFREKCNAQALNLKIALPKVDVVFFSFFFFNLFLNFSFSNNHPLLLSIYIGNFKFEIAQILTQRAKAACKGQPKFTMMFLYQKTHRHTLFRKKNLLYKFTTNSGAF